MTYTRSRTASTSSTASRPRSYLERDFTVRGAGGVPGGGHPVARRRPCLEGLSRIFSVTAPAVPHRST